jgi:hypothetical protein
MVVLARPRACRKPSREVILASCSCVIWTVWLYSTMSSAPTEVISLRLGFRRNFLSVLHPNLVSSPIKGILEILNLTTRCIPMDICHMNSVIILNHEFCTYRSNLVEIRIPKKFSVCSSSPIWWRTDRKFLRNPNLNEITSVGAELMVEYHQTVHMTNI